MSSSDSMFSRQQFPSHLILALSIIFFLAVAIPVTSSPSLWGINLLSYFDWSVCLPVALASLAAAFIVILLGTAANLHRQLKRLVLYFIIPITLLAVFYLLRAKTHYLGDGLLRIKELEIGVWWLPTEPLAQAANYLVYKITSSLFGFNATTAVEVVSYLGGIFYYFALLGFVKTAVRNSTTQLLAFILLYFSGMTVLFCGYAETYMLLPGLMALFFTAGVKAAQGKSSPLLTLFLFLLLVFFHFKSLILAPCVAYLAYIYFKDKSRMHAALAVSTIIVALIAAAIVPTLSKLPTLSAAGFLLPFAAGGTEYTLFSSQHLLDILNQLLLVSAAPLIVLLVLCIPIAKSRLSLDRPSLFVAWALPGAIAMLVLLHSRLGFAVDWDLFSSSALIVSFFAVMIFARREKLQINRSAAVALASVGFLSFSAFAGVNSQFDVAVKRQVDILSLYGKEGAIGFESMGNHLNSIGQSTLAEQMWRKSLFLRPHVRMYANLAQLSLNEGRIPDAKYYSEKGLELDSTHATLWNHLGVALTRYGDLTAAERALLNAVRFDPNNADYHHNYSIMLTQAQRWEDAEAQSREALRLLPGDPAILTGLGIALTNAGKLAEAENILMQVIAIAPSNGEPYFHLSRIYLMRSDTTKWRQVLGDYVSRYPDSPTTPRIKRVLESIQPSNQNQ